MYFWEIILIAIFTKMSRKSILIQKKSFIKKTCFSACVFLLLVIITKSNLFAQNVANINNNWVFADSVHLQFQNVPSVLTTPTVGARTNNMQNAEGNASISDGTGNLLFYAARNTAGVTFGLYDANDNPMPFGQNLISHESASQGIIIAQDPDNCNQYYVFYTSAAIGNGLRYSKVDMTLNLGFGDVIPGQKDILLYNTRCEKVTLVQKTGSKHFWVITRRVDPAAGFIDEPVSIEWQRRFMELVKR